jgi:hypothetical protein
MSSEVSSQKVDGLNLLISDDIVIEVDWRTLFLQARDVGKSEAPIAAGSARHDVQVKVRNLLTTANAVVLHSSTPSGQLAGISTMRHK